MRRAARCGARPSGQRRMPAVRRPDALGSGRRRPRPTATSGPATTACAPGLATTSDAPGERRRSAVPVRRRHPPARRRRPTTNRPTPAATGPERPELELGANISTRPRSGRTRTRRDRRAPHATGSARSSGAALLGQLRGGQAAAVAARRGGGDRRRSIAPRRPAGAFLGTLLVGGSLLVAFAPRRPPHRRGVGAGRRSRSRFGSCGGRLRFRSRAPAGGMVAAERPGPLRRLLTPSAPGSAARAQGRPDPRRCPTATARSGSSPSIGAAG